MRRAFPFAAVLMMLSAHPAYAEDPSSSPSEAAEAPPSARGYGPVLGTGTVGLDFALPASGQVSVGGQYFIAHGAALVADVGLGLVFSTPGTGASAIDVALDVGYRGYLHPVGRLYPFFQPTLHLERVSANDTVTLGVTGGFGLEYFFTDRFSVGGTLNLALGFSNIGGPGNLGVALTTSTSNLFAGFKW